MTRAQEGIGAHDVVRVGGKGAVTQTEIVELPAPAGPAGFGRFPTPRPLLLIERLAGQTRIDAKAQRGCTSERLRGGEVACHRSVDGAPSWTGCQRNIGEMGGETQVGVVDGRAVPRWPSTPSQSEAPPVSHAASQEPQMNKTRPLATLETVGQSESLLC